MRLKAIDVGIISHEGSQPDAFFATVEGEGLTRASATLVIPNGDKRSLSSYDDTLMAFYDTGDLSVYSAGEYEVTVRLGREEQRFSARLGDEKPSRAPEVKCTAGSQRALRVNITSPQNLAEGAVIDVITRFADPSKNSYRAVASHRIDASIDQLDIFDLTPGTKYQVVALASIANTNGIMSAGQCTASERIVASTAE